MNYNRIWLAGLVSLVALAVMAPDAEAYRGGRHGRWRGGYYGGNSFSFGVSIGSYYPGLPRRCRPFYWGGYPYYYYSGVYYRPYRTGYIVVDPPTISSLPPGAIKVTVAGTTYYKVNDTYYLKQPQGYVAVPSPVDGAPPRRPSIPYEVGKNWAGDVRDNIVSWQEFVDFLEDDILDAPSPVIREFRKGFIEVYGKKNGPKAFEMAMEQAREQ